MPRPAAERLAREEARSLPGAGALRSAAPKSRATHASPLQDGDAGHPAAPRILEYIPINEPACGSELAAAMAQRSWGSKLMG